MPDRSISQYLYEKKTVHAPTTYRVNIYEDRCRQQRSYPASERVPSSGCVERPVKRTKRDA